MKQLFDTEIVPKIIKFDVFGPFGFIRMEQCPGKTLDKLMEEDDGIIDFHFPIIQQQLCQKLKQLHNLNIVHLDIKSNNLIYDISSKQLRFIDFGRSFTFREVEMRCNQIYQKKK